MNFYHLRVFRHVPIPGEPNAWTEGVYWQQILELQYNHTGDYIRSDLEAKLKRMNPEVTRIELERM